MSPQSVERRSSSDIAIVGMAGRFPGARTLEEYWQNLRDGVEALTETTDADLTREGVSLKVRQARHVRSGFTLSDIDMFDSAFFGINPREAEILDPQHRLFLECAWQALEDAGCDAERFDGTIGLFGGATWCNYLINNLFRSTRLLRSIGHRALVFGSVPDYMATRVAYRLNLKGPACFVQTACSTSLVAIHMGTQSLLNHECDLVLAGGVSIKVPHHVGYVYEEGGMESPDGHVRAFDAAAKGTVFGSGVGIVVLKRLDDAVRNGDTILAVVRGSATNNDGAVKVGFTAPSVTGQAQVVSMALRNAGISGDEIDYIEAHGTGTELGDPIELAALARAYEHETDRTQYCAVGSVKPNIGHLDAAAGVSSVIKTILAMRHAQLPPSINFERLNPKIEIEHTPFYINTTLREWPANGHPRRAGVSSFGFGGTNAHIILEEAPARRATSTSRSHQLVVLSARTASALDAASVQLATHLARDTRTDLADVAFTLQTGRRQFAHRRAIVCESRADAIPALQGEPSRWVSTAQAASGPRRVVFLFPGQGAQYPNMGRGLYEAEPVFRQAVDECASMLQPLVGFDLREALYPAEGAEADAAARLKQTAVTQAALFTTELALARLWMHWGIQPSAMAGHSIGEIVAAHLSGVLTLGDALRLVALRGRLMEEMPAGSMLAVPLPEERVRPLLAEGLWLAAANSPSLCVVSGTTEAIERLEQRLVRDGVEGRRLHTSHAFHSGLMEPAVQPFVDAVAAVTRSAPTIPYVSNVTGGWASEALVSDPAYWGRHIREAVRFADNIAALASEPDTVFVEVGPGNTLSTFVRQATTPQDGHVVLASLRHPNEPLADSAVILHALGRLWAAGAAVDWSAFAEAEVRNRVRLPTYPFERTRHWVDPEKPSAAALRRSALAQGNDLADWFYVPSWKQSPIAAVGDGRTPESWLLFADETGVAGRLAERLRARGDTVALVSAGSSASAPPADYVLDPAAPGGYEALVRALRDRPSRIVHCWGVDGGAEAIGAQQIQQRGFYSVLDLAKAIGAAGITSPMRLDVITTGLHEVIGTESLVPDKATVLGPARVVPLEFPNLACRTIDFQPDELRDGASGLDDLVGELLAAGKDADVAYRRGRRWVQNYEAMRIGSASASLEARLKEGGTYLITGGLGGIGLVLARDLASLRRCNLVLTGRSGLPPRETWEERLASAPGDAVSRKILAVRDLEAIGATVVVGDADVADAARMAQVVADARARFGRVDGVIHSAGVAGGGVIQLKAHEAAAAVLRPKVEGTQILGRLLEQDPPDFLVLCSSLTSVLGGAGQVDYCGANAYLDSFARWFGARTGVQTVAINWSAWQEVGMAVETDMPEAAKGTIREQMLAVGLSNREGADALRRILGAARCAQVAVSPLDVQLVLERAREEMEPETAASGASAGNGAASAPRPATHARPKLPVAYLEPRTDTERRLCEIWEDMLGVGPVGINDNFFDLGGHSLLAVRVMTRVNEVMRTEVPVAKLYEGLTVGFLGQVIDARLTIGQPAQAAAKADEDDVAARRRDKLRRKEHQQRRLAATRR
jgi:acyl transferase domain-containing protein